MEFAGYDLIVVKFNTSSIFFVDHFIRSEQLIFGIQLNMAQV